MNETLTSPRELDHRDDGGLSVTLLWFEESNSVAVHSSTPTPVRSSTWK
jgi:hypothetical protein